MRLTTNLRAVGFAAVVVAGTALPSLAHGPGPQGGYRSSDGWGPGWMMGQGHMMGPGHMMGQGWQDGFRQGPGWPGGGWTGHGMMGRDWSGPGWMGPGMMGPGMTGRGMMGRRQPGPGSMQPLREDLSVDDVRHMLEHRLGWANNPNVKLGEVEAEDADTIIASIVTQDGSLVERLAVNRHTGWMEPVR